MKEENDQGNKGLINTNVEAPRTGIFTECHPSDQPRGTVRFRLNGNDQTREGDDNLSTNEEGNQSCGSLPTGYIPLGKAYMNNGRNAILSVSKDEAFSEIGIQDSDCNYTTIVNFAGLGFRLNKQIDIRYRSRRGCEDVIYFVDGQYVRSFNFNKLRDFYSQDYIDFLSSGEDTFTGSMWDANKFNVFPSYKIPCFAKMEVITGGSIVPGTLNFSIAYLDDDLNPTNWIYTSQLVSIFQSDLSSNYSDINGSSNVLNDGLGGIAATNKSVKLTLNNLDETYKYYQIGVVFADNGTGRAIRVLKSPPFPIGATTYIFDGNIEGYTEATTAELFLGKTDVQSAENIEQLETKLILNNIKGKQVPYCTFQKFASKIATNYIIKEVPQNVNELVDGDPKHPNTYWDTEGYMGGEVYSAGIVYVFNDGLETPVFHVPGRSPGQYYRQTDGTIIDTDDQDIIDTWTQDVSPWFSTPEEYNSLPSDRKIKKWQVYDTSHLYSPDGINESFGAMGYHENQTSTYTKLDDCSEDNSFWGIDACGNPLEGTPVRHHQFPNRLREPQVRSGTLVPTTTGLYYDVDLQPSQVFPGSPPTLVIDYEINGTPFTKSIVINSTDLPINRVFIDSSTGDFSTITITSVTGLDPVVFNFDVYRDVQSQGGIIGSILRVLGIQFSNIEYPHPDIVGHYFVRGPRDEQNRTILDKGYCNNVRHKLVNGIDYTGFAYFLGDVNQLTNDNYLFTPRFCFNRETLNGDYLKWENMASQASHYIGTTKYDAKGGIFTETNNVIEFRARQYMGVDSTSHPERNFPVDKSLIMDAVSKNTTFENANTPVYNLSWSNRVHIVNTMFNFPRYNDTDMPYVSYKVIRDVHPQLSQITYQRMHNCMLTLENTQKVFGGDTFISRWDLSTSMYRTQKKGVAKKIVGALLVVIAAVATVVTAGIATPLLAGVLAGAVGAAAAAGIATAVYVAAVLAAAIGVTGEGISLIVGEIDGDLENMTFDRELADATGRGWSLANYIAYSNETLLNLFVESEVNVGLREKQNNLCGNFITYADSPGTYFRDRWLYLDQTTNKWTPKGLCCPENYWYNIDYSRQNTQNQYFPLPDSYDCCSDCLESHPNRTLWSQDGFQEELTDNYKVFLPNNYRDTEAEHGPCTAIMKRDNNLFLFASEGLWVLPQQQQQQINGELVTFIGTGEFFSISPKKLEDSAIGILGTQHKWACINIPQGLFIVNEIEGKVYLFNQNFSEISKDNASWFKNNLKNFFGNQYYQITGKVFPNLDNNASPYGVGIHVGYDEFYKRVILTKRDYLLLPQYISTFQIIQSVSGVIPSLAPGIVVFDTTLNKFIVTGSSTTSYTIIGFDSSAYFENKSWSFSYSLKNNSWTSWHSYIPNFYIYNHNDLFMTTSINPNIWKHNIKGLYHNYFGIAYPHILEVAISSDPLATKYWEDIVMQTIARKYNSSYNEYAEQRYVTFNKLTAYNDRQCTGELTLVPRDIASDVSYMRSQVTQPDNSRILISKRENDWAINDLRDFRDDYTTPIFLRNWNSLKSNYFIDKLVDSSNINYNKDWSQLEVLRDKYIILRFKFDNFTDVQLITKYLLDTSGISQ